MLALIRRKMMQLASGMLFPLAIVVGNKASILMPPAHAADGANGTHLPAGLSEGTADGPQLLGIAINGSDLNMVTTVLRRGDQLLLRIDDLDHWRIRHPQTPTIIDGGVGYLALSALPGVTASIDEQQQMLRLSVPTAQFLETAISVTQPAATAPQGNVLGGFMNYDLLAEKGENYEAFSGFFEAGISDDWAFFRAPR